MATLDHLIVKVNELPRSLAFYTRILGFADEGPDGPFAVLRIGPDSLLQLAPWGTRGLEHYAFAMPRAEFDAVLSRLREDGIPWGPSFHAVGQGGAPGSENGAHGPAPCVYFNDPDQHLLEIRCTD